MTPTEAGEIALLAKLEGFMPYLQDMAANMQAALIRKAKTMKEKGLLTPQMSQEILLEYLTVDTLVARFTRKRTGAQGLARVHEALLTGDGRLE